jgi:hypothetical protein
MCAATYLAYSEPLSIHTGRFSICNVPENEITWNPLNKDIFFLLIPVAVNISSYFKLRGSISKHFTTMKSMIMGLCSHVVWGQSRVLEEHISIFKAEEETKK